MYLFLGPVVLGLLPKEISYIQGIYTNSICVCVHSCFGHVQLSVTPLTVAHHAPPSMGFFRQEYWNGLPFPAPRDLPHPGIKLTSQRLLHCRRILYPLSHMESPNSIYFCCCCSVAKLCLSLCDPMDCSTPGFPVLTISWNLLKLMSIESVMPSNHLILCRPLLLLPSIFLSIKAFDCVGHNKLWKILKEMGIADHLWGYWYLRLLTSWQQDCWEKYQ